MKHYNENENKNDNDNENSATVKTNGVRAWILAARPKTLTGAAAPVLIGGAMGWQMGFRSADSIATFVLCLLFAFLMQIDSNIINDYFDFKKGSDREDRLGPERACAQGWITPRAMTVGIATVTTLACCTGAAIMFIHMQFELLIVGALCVLFAFLYTTRLSYMGWGDVLVLVFFGIVPVTFTYYAMTGGDWGVPLIVAGVAMGLATDNLLMVNNYRDRHQDRVSGKRTIVVRLMDKHGDKEGELDALDIYLWLGVFATLLGFTALFLFPPSTIRYPLLLIYLILHFRAFKQIKTLDGKQLNQVLGTTARNIFIFGMLTAASCWL